MNPCQNCGKLNAGESVFCRFCGTKFNFQKPVLDNPFDHSAPKPYSWKTDEFTTQNEVRHTLPIDRIQPLTGQFNPAPQNYSPAPLSYQKNQNMHQPFRCPRCMSQYIPRIERKISTAGWITFAVLLIFVFPLFWIGLLIKEDVRICQSCNTRLG